MAKNLVFNVLTGTLTEVDQTPEEIASMYPTLEQAQQAKINELTNVNNTLSTFKSSALGLAHTYLADSDATAKFNAEYTYVNSSSYDGSPILWYTVEEGGVSHTKAQFNQVWLDGRNYMSSNFSKWDSLVKQVKVITVTTTEQDAINKVNAISW